jgi:hypothetical protein
LPTIEETDFYGSQLFLIHKLPTTPTIATPATATATPISKEQTGSDILIAFTLRQRRKTDMRAVTHTLGDGQEYSSHDAQG